MNANSWKSYFEFSRKERIGIVSLLVILVMIWFAPLLFVPEERFDEKGYVAFRDDIERLNQQTAPQKQGKNFIKAAGTSDNVTPPLPLTLFYFDPNQLSIEGWQRLGITAKTAAIIRNYRDKGGRFYKPEELGKIYGLKAKDYERLLPYVRIEEKQEEKRYTAGAARRSRPIAGIIDINTADTTDFITLPGIGSKLANRIISFREKLGGFYTVEQLTEVYGLKDSVLQKIKSRLHCDTPALKKININVADVNELKAHPYIKYQLANAVIRYRLAHGRFRSGEDLLQIHLFSDDALRKLEPYISY
ncbi:MAG: helix-hairpin-helix domain-containing protein [Chitinophagaceae bacterium]|nr:helix-hairpin-helix domain-containing protein [Chitinophagaceae bacterium]